MKDQADQSQYLDASLKGSSDFHFSTRVTPTVVSISAPEEHSKVASIMDSEVEMPTPSAMKVFDTPQPKHKSRGSSKKSKKKVLHQTPEPPPDAEEKLMTSPQIQSLLSQSANPNTVLSEMRDEEQAASAGLLALTANENSMRAEALAEAQAADLAATEDMGALVNNLQAQDNHDINVDPSLEAAPTTKTAKPKKRKRQSDQETAGPSKRVQAAAPHIQNGPPDDYPSQGPFTPAERDVVDLYARAFLDEYRISRETLNDIVQSKERKMDDITRDFWHQAYTILPNRDNKAMQRHVRRRFHNFTSRGKWTEEEDELLKQAYEERPNQWKLIGESLARMPEDCRDRWRNYVVCGDTRKTDHWDDEEETELGMAVEDCITQIKKEAKQKAAEERLAFREDQDWESQINFNAVSERLGRQRSRIQCLQHWKAMQERARTGRIKRGSKQAKQAKLMRVRKSGAGRKPGGGMKKHFYKMEPGDKYAILQELINTGVYEEDKIPWQLLAQRSPKCRWSIADRKYAFGRMKQLLPEMEDLQQLLGALVQYLEQHHGDRLDVFYDGPDAPAIPSEPTKVQQPQAKSPIGADDTNEMSIDPSLRTVTQDGENSATPATTEKRGRGRPKKNADTPRRSKKAGKNFKSDERVDDADEDAIQRAAPQANMVSSKNVRGRRNLVADLNSTQTEGHEGASQQLPGNSYDPEADPEAIVHPADQHFKKLLEQANAEAEPQLPPLRRGAGEHGRDGNVRDGKRAAVRQSSEL